jgi:hypothetical protein
MRTAIQGIEAALVGAAILAASSGGCSVPEVTFFADDGASDASTDTVLADDVTAPDVADVAVDAGDAGDAGDAMIGCNPEALPTGATMCCGPIACNGCVTPTDCMACEMKQCTTSQLCCVRAQGASCRMTGMACP